MTKLKVAVPEAKPHGITPLEYKVLIRPNIDDGTIKFKGGFVLHKPDETKERDDHATMEGTVAALSPLAFSYEADAPKPNVGQTVVFQRYSGLRITGEDGVEYRLMNDKDVVAARSA
jgi:co-chaperonin GroES (HSP10)